MSDICKNNLNDRHAAAAAHLPSKPFFRSRHIWNGVRQCIPCCREALIFFVCKRIANGGHFFSYVRNLTFFALRTIKKPKDFFRPQLAAYTPVRLWKRMRGWPSPFRPSSPSSLSSRKKTTISHWHWSQSSFLPLIFHSKDTHLKGSNFEGIGPKANFNHRFYL